MDERETVDDVGCGNCLDGFDRLGHWFVSARDQGIERTEAADELVELEAWVAAVV